MGKNKKFDYFKSFSKQAAYAIEGAELLLALVKNYKQETLLDELERMRKIENAADKAIGVVNTQLLKEFIAPLEREDIVLLTDNLDDITDYIEEVLQHLYIYNIQEIPAPALEMIKITTKACHAIKSGLDVFSNFKRSDDALQHLAKVHEYEEQCDGLFLTAMHDLFANDDFTRDMFVWRHLYSKIEKCCDACQTVSSTIRTIVLKNS